MNYSLSAGLPDDLRQRFTGAAQKVLMLDYDGTLAPFTPRRDEAVPYPGVTAILERIIASEKSRVVVISGRAIDDLIPLLGLAKAPEIWGCHGWEYRDSSGAYCLEPLPEEAARGMAEAQAMVRQLGVEDYIEKKPVSLALHWRGLTSQKVQKLSRIIEGAWAPLVDACDLELHHFDGGLELRCPGKNKGSAVNSVLAELSHEGFCAYLGDDATDEDAFAAMGERGLSVLVRTQWRPTRAKVWLKPPEQLLEFLRLWENSCSC